MDAGKEASEIIFEHYDAVKKWYNEILDITLPDTKLVTFEDSDDHTGLEWAILSAKGKSGRLTNDDLRIYDDIRIKSEESLLKSQYSDLEIKQVDEDLNLEAGHISDTNVDTYTITARPAIKHIGRVLREFPTFTRALLIHEFAHIYQYEEHFDLRYPILQEGIARTIEGIFFHTGDVSSRDAVLEYILAGEKLSTILPTHHEPAHQKYKDITMTGLSTIQEITGFRLSNPSKQVRDKAIRLVKSEKAYAATELLARISVYSIRINQKRKASEQGL